MSIIRFPDVSSFHCTVVAICFPFLKSKGRVTFQSSIPRRFWSGVIGLFLHVRCIPQQNSQWQFWASVYVYIYIYVCVWILHKKYKNHLKRIRSMAPKFGPSLVERHQNSSKTNLFSRSWQVWSLQTYADIWTFVCWHRLALHSSFPILTIQRSSLMSSTKIFGAMMARLR